MIGVALKGGLGNQMFQYATARRLAIDLGVGLRVSVGALSQPRPNQTHRPFELDSYQVQCEICDISQEREIALAARLGRLSKLVTEWRVYTERGLGFDPKLLQQNDGTLLRGYWQSEKYFRDRRDVIAKELTPVQPLPPQQQALRLQIASGPSVSLHVRRGDYVSLPSAAKFHGTLPLDYYKRALERLRQIEPSPVVYVFTDDPAWCKMHLSLNGCKAHHVSADLTSTGIQDLTLMASCRHHVIANSSFSWWGAWLGGATSARAGIVIAPGQWFAAGVKDDVTASDRFPSNWEVV